VVEAIMSITDGIVVMTFLDRRPVQLLKTVIRGLAPIINMMKESTYCGSPMGSSSLYRF